MPRQPIITQQMLTGAVMNLEHTQRSDKAIIAELWRLYNIRIGRTRLRFWMKKWEISANAKDIGRREAKQAVANALVGEKMEELRSQIGGLNRAEELIGGLLEKAEATLNGTDLPKDLETLAAVLAEAKTLMVVASQVRKDMADIRVGLGAEKPADPDTGVLTPHGGQVVDFASAIEKYKNL